MIKFNATLKKNVIYLLKVTMLSVILVPGIQIDQSYSQSKMFKNENRRVPSNSFAIGSNTATYYTVDAKKLLPPPNDMPVSKLHIVPMKKISDENFKSIKVLPNAAIDATRILKKDLVEQVSVPAPTPAPSRVPVAKVTPIKNLKEKIVRPEKKKSARNPGQTITSKKKNKPSPNLLSPSKPPPLPKTVSVASVSSNTEATSIKEVTKNIKDTSKIMSQPKELKLGQALRINFINEETKLNKDAEAKLYQLSEQLANKPELRIQLMAFAGAKGMSISKARRQSLSRALTVRSFLMKKGLRSTRIDVRALGNKSSELPINRVDVNIVER